MSAPISMDKQYRTRDGRKVRVLCVDSGDVEFPVVALVSNESSGNDMARYTADGFWLSGDLNKHELDLVEVNQCQVVKPSRISWNEVKS